MKTALIIIFLVIEEGYSRSWCSVFCTGFGPVIKIHLDFTSCFDKKQLIFLGGVTLWEKKENA